jgi:DNA-binding MarR family transcriptional regulator
MSNRLDRLEKSRLIVRGPHPEDRRGVVVQLTEKGRALIDEAVTAHVANEHEVLSVLTREEQDRLAELLEKLISGVS